MVKFGQVAATSQFYLYGRKHCTQIGYQRSRRKLLQAGADPLDSVDLSGHVCMVTGANSGCGQEVATFLAQKNATVYLVCRSEKRGEEARKKIVESTGNESVFLLVCDCSLEADVRAVWRAFCDHREATAAAPPRLDVLVCNAGVLLNEKTLTSEGVETTLACHLLFGTYLLGELAMGALEATAGSRIVVVSSGGMYNTKFPAWADASAESGTYNGNLAYAYAKRGQVLLCERWAALHPAVACVSCHPGWSNTPAVDEAYGDMKKYLEPLRTPWEGAEGIAWLCAADAAGLRSGAFYLDRRVEPKHIAGPFFSEGSYTKNSAAEVDAMMASLAAWSNGRRVLSPPEESQLARRTPLAERSAPVELERFMGRWFVLAALPTFVDRGAHNSIEDYSWDGRRQRVDVSFKMKPSATADYREYKQRAYVANAPSSTRWTINPRAGGVYLPLGLSYLIIDCAEDYSHTIVGAPDRSFLYVMARTHEIEPALLEALLEKAERAGYDRAKLEMVPHDYSTPPPPEPFGPPPVPRTVAGVAHEGKPRVCVAAMSPSHNSARAKMVLDAISDSEISSHETWARVFPRGSSSPYYEWVERLKSELPPEEAERFASRKGWSSPFVWIERPDGTRHALGGRQEFCAWALEEYAEDAKVVQIASTPPRASEAFASLRRPGNALPPAGRAVDPTPASPTTEAMGD